MVSILIYVLCPDEAAYEKAQKIYTTGIYKCIIIESTKYLESIMYLKVLMENYSEWENKDYVGTLSWRANTKIDIPNKLGIEKLCIEDPDVISFHGINKTLLVQAKQHCYFQQIWLKSLSKFNFEREQIIDPTIKLFLCNYWIAKPKLMKKYIEFANKFRRVIEDDKELQNDYMNDATYKDGSIDKDTLLKIFDRPYYTYHPFIFERLPCFFFHQQNAKIYMCYNRWHRPNGS